VVQTSTAPVHAKDEIEGVIAALAGNPGAGLIATPDPFNLINRDLIIFALSAEELLETGAGLSGLTFIGSNGGTLTAPIHRY